MAIAASLLAHDAFSQNVAPAGFRFYRGENGSVTAINYWGEGGLRAAKLREFPHLECIEISYGSNLSNDDIEYLSTLTNLTELVIGQSSVDSPVMIAGDLRKLKTLKSLESFHLCKRDIIDSDLEFVADLPKLTHLELIAENSYGDQSDLTDDCADFLVRAKSLESIYFEGTAKFTDAFMSKITKGLPSLKNLDLSCPELTNNSLRMLATRSKKLQRLQLRSDQITDTGVGHIANATHLRELRLYSNSLSKQCLQHMAPFKKLQDLELTLPAIDDNGARVLANLRQLESLILRETEFTDRQIEMFRNHPRLKRVFIRGSNLSADVVVKLIGDIPDLEYISIGSKNPDLQALINRTLLGKPNNRD